MAKKQTLELVTTSPTPLATPDGSPAIYFIRNERVMLDSDLAAVYEVETGAINRAVNRNASRFPERFAFQLQREEWASLRDCAKLSCAS